MILSLAILLYLPGQARATVRHRAGAAMSEGFGFEVAAARVCREAAAALAPSRGDFKIESYLLNDLSNDA
jgi:hypothetical protein